MKISTVKFLEKYNQLLCARKQGIELFAYWKMKWLIENGDTFYLPKHDCYYLIRDNHLLMYYSPDNRMHLSTQELNGLDCISLPTAMYDNIKESLEGFNPSHGWGLRYDFNYQPRVHISTQYEAINFDFSDSAYYTKAAEIICGGNGDWFNEKNVKKMTSYSAFDPTLWFYVRDKVTQDLAAISISAYDAEVRQTDLDWIYVASNYQGKGCGRFLIEETVRRCKDKSQSICVGGAVEFYRKCGFVDYESWVWAPKEGYQFKAGGIQP